MAIPTSDPSAVPEETASPVTKRAILLGALTGAVLNIYGDYTGMILGSSSLVKSQLSMAMLLPFMAWLALNLALKALTPRFALRSTELLTIYSMSWIVGTMPASGWLTYWGGIVSSPMYYASPENGWEEHLFDVMPWWSLPVRSEEVIRAYYEGLPPGSAIPWGGWVPTLFWWFSISLALMLAGLCLSVIFQHQWESAERLTFPLAVFPVELTQGFDAPDRVPAIFKNKIFWAGFFAVFAVFGWNMIGYFHEDLPRITLYDRFLTKEVHLGRNFPPLYSRILPPVVGFTYLCNLDILFSFFIFRILAILKEGLMSRVGLTVGYSGQQADPPEILTLESHGALVFLVLWSVWTARTHLRRVATAAWEGARSRWDDGLVPYRYCVIGLACATVYALSWFIAVGLSPFLAVIHLALMFVAYFAIAKYTALTGFSYLFPVGAKGGPIIESIFGTAHLSRRNFVGLGMINSSAFYGNTRVPAWPALPHHLKLLSEKAKKKSWVFWSAIFAFAAGFFASCLFIIYLGYDHAGQNLGLSGFARTNRLVYDGMVSAIVTDDKTIFDPAKVAVWLIGLGGAWLLTVLNNRLAWWPLHPLGLAFQTTAGLQFYAFSIFITWCAKIIILRIGGISLYNRARPFFFGLVIGYLASLGTSSIVDYIWFPGEGHFLHGW